MRRSIVKYTPAESTDRKVYIETPQMLKHLRRLDFVKSGTKFVR